MLNEIAIFKKAIEKFGIDNQVLKAIEELAELIRALVRPDIKNLREEIADVKIILSQLEIIYSKKEIGKYYKSKLNRLASLCKS